MERVNSLSICRICLIGNVLMRRVLDKKLQDVYEKLSSVPFESGDNPSVLCYMCYEKLRKCYQFATKCTENDAMFTQMIEDCDEKNQEKIKLCNPLSIVTRVNIFDAHYIEQGTVKSEEADENGQYDVISSSVAQKEGFKTSYVDSNGVKVKLEVGRETEEMETEDNSTPKKKNKRKNQVNQKGKNQFGGEFINGCPLANHIRLKIVELANSGVRQTEIAKRLKVSHGSVQKIMHKYRATGSISHGAYGRTKRRIGRPRSIVTPEVETYIKELKKENPYVTPWDVRERIIKEGICQLKKAPSMNQISSIISNVTSTVAMEAPLKSYSRRPKTDAVGV